MFSRFSPAILAFFPALAVVFAAPGCGNAPSAPVSKIVEANSEEGRKAQADDEAHRQMLRRQEAKAAARKRGLHLPDES